MRTTAEESWSLDPRRRSPATITNKRNHTCYECGNQSITGVIAHKYKEPNHGNHQAGGKTNAHAESSAPSDEPLAIPLDGLHIDDKLRFVEEPVEIMDRKVKRLKQSHIPIIKVQWNSRRGPEFTWEHEDQFQEKYPHLQPHRRGILIRLGSLCPSPIAVEESDMSN
ncbi:hypothetical protein Tco_0366330 [Tanacetum coccineum]